MRRAGAALAALLLSACVGLAQGPVLGPSQGPGGTEDIKVAAIPVEIVPDLLDGLRMVSAVALSADHPWFGGFSGLRMDPGHLVAVSDGGWWLLADVEIEKGYMRLPRAGLAPIRDENGEPLDKRRGDAEGLTVRDNRMVVSFERDHRIAVHIADGRVGEEIRDPAFDDLAWNKGLEALATTPDGWLIALGEARIGGATPVLVIRHSGRVDRATIPASGPHLATGADVGPDGRLYVLLRHYAPFFGVSVRIHRYDLDEDGYPVAETLKVMAEFDSKSGIDNMEGIALWRDAAGTTHLTMISDDNFSLLQRTLLVDLEVLE